jgi:hypothetical protein
MRVLTLTSSPSSSSLHHGCNPCPCPCAAGVVLRPRVVARPRMVLSLSSSPPSQIVVVLLAIPGHRPRSLSLSSSLSHIITVVILAISCPHRRHPRCLASPSSSSLPSHVLVVVFAVPCCPRHPLSSSSSSMVWSYSLVHSKQKNK